ncbi:hypothetical protein Plhal703r1_c04g0021731 [Plasmopara halstedii]
MSVNLRYPTFSGIVFLALAFALLVYVTFDTLVQSDTNGQSDLRYLKQIEPYDFDHNDERYLEWLGSIVHPIVGPAVKLFEDTALRLTIHEEEFITHLFAEHNIDPLREKFVESAEFLSVADKIMNTFFFKEQSIKAIFDGLSRAAGESKDKMLVFLAWSIGEFKAKSEFKIIERHFEYPQDSRNYAEKLEKEKAFNRLRDIVLSFEPYLLETWRKMGLTSEKVREHLHLDPRSANFVKDPNLPLYKNYLAIAPPYEYPNPIKTLLFQMEIMGLNQHEIVSRLLDAEAVTKPDSIAGQMLNHMFLDWDKRSIQYAELYRILVPSLIIDEKSVVNGILRVWILYFSRHKTIDLYEELARVIVTSRLIESDTGVELVAIPKNSNNFIPPIPERDFQLADTLASKVFGSRKEFVTPKGENDVKVVVEKKAGDEEMLFTQKLFKGLRMYWSHCGLSPYQLFDLMKLNELTHAQLLSNPHLWTFMVYTTEHVQSFDERGNQMMMTLETRLNDEEIARLITVMRAEDKDIFLPLLKRVTDRWNERGKSFHDLFMTLGLKKDPLSNSNIVLVFCYYRQYGHPAILNILLLRKFLETQYPGEDLEKVILERMISTEGYHRKVLFQILISSWLNEGRLEEPFVSVEGELQGKLQKAYAKAVNTAVRKEEFGLDLKFDESQLQVAFLQSASKMKIALTHSKNEKITRLKPKID